MWIITGSTAAYHWYPDSRVPEDLDILTPAEITIKGLKDCHIDTKWHELAIELINRSKNKVFLDADLLLTLKLSHSYWDIHFNKTMYDIDFLMNKGCKVDEEMYEKLYKMWEEIHGKKLANLNVSNAEFFTERVVRRYDHDFLHEQLAFNERPMHERIRKDQDSPLCSIDLWNELSYNQKIETALEELMAVAVERKSLTKENSKIEVMNALQYAFKQLVTSMTKGWFARFLVENNREILSTRREICTNSIKNVLSKL